MTGLPYPVTEFDYPVKMNLDQGISLNEALEWCKVNFGKSWAEKSDGVWFLYTTHQEPGFYVWFLFKNKNDKTLFSMRWG